MPTFERYVESQGIDRGDWAVHLSTLLRGKALEVYSRLPTEDALNYDMLITALQKRYQMTEDGFRNKFRSCKPEKGENPVQFVARMSQYFNRWVDLSGIEHNYKSIVNLILMEQFLNSCPKERNWLFT